MSRSIPQLSVVIPAGATPGVGISSLRISQNPGVHQGEIILVKVVTPAFTVPITVIIAIYDRNGIKKWESESLASNSGAQGYSIFLPRPIPIEHGEIFKVFPSADPTAPGGTVVINAEYRPDVFTTI